MPSAWPPILVLGRDSCSDTTMSRGHLDARGIPYDYRRVDEDVVADAWILRINDGMCSTPTILIGDPDRPSRILVEPSNEELDEAIAAAAG